MNRQNPWSVQYTEFALQFIRDNVHSKRVAEKIFSYRELLEEFPDIGANYNPQYSAARPPFPCRSIAVPDTPFSLYYLKDEAARRIIIFAIEYNRSDPNSRFSHVDWAMGGF